MRRLAAVVIGSCVLALAGAPHASAACSDAPRAPQAEGGTATESAKPCGPAEEIARRHGQESERGKARARTPKQRAKCLRRAAKVRGVTARKIARMICRAPAS